MRLTFRARVNLGPLHYWWAPDDQEIPVGETVLLPLELPREAYLHDEAMRYVTSVRVFAQTWVDDQAGQEVQLPMQYAWWPDGPAGLVEVMDRDEMDAVMPGGTTLPLAEDVLNDKDVAGRLLVEPPILEPAPSPADPPPGPRPEHESQEPDDQRDEVLP